MLFSSYYTCFPLDCSTVGQIEEAIYAVLLTWLKKFPVALLIYYSTISEI